MIKINLDNNIKEELKKMFLQDAEESETGIIKILSNEEKKKHNIELLSAFQELQSFLYPNGEFNKKNLEDLLLADKAEMLDYIQRFQNEYDDKNAEDEQKKKVKQLLREIFRYDSFSKRKVVAEIQEKLNISVCPYCNRNYITVISKSGIRAPFDHYFPKSRYPYLALSLYNLIPCCFQCNNMKNNLDTVKEAILYPYEDEFGYDTTFYCEENNDSVFSAVWSGSSDEFSIKINSENSSNPKTVEKQNDCLKILLLYNNTHKGLIRKIILQNKIATAEYMRTIQKQFPDLFPPKENIWNLVYMNNIEKQDWKDNPLAKLTHDIHHQINDSDC